MLFLYDNIQELLKANGSLAQLARASALQAEGHWFESINSHHIIKNKAQRSMTFDTSEKTHHKF